MLYNFKQIWDRFQSKCYRLGPRCHKIRGIRVSEPYPCLPSYTPNPGNPDRPPFSEAFQPPMRVCFWPLPTDR